MDGEGSPSYGQKTHRRFQGREVSPTERLMPLPAHSISADHPVVPCTAQFRSPRSPLDSAMGTGAGSACPGDCAPRGNVPRILAAVCLAAEARLPRFKLTL